MTLPKVRWLLGGPQPPRNLDSNDFLKTKRDWWGDLCVGSMTKENEDFPAFIHSLANYLGSLRRKSGSAALKMWEIQHSICISKSLQLRNSRRHYQDKVAIGQQNALAGVVCGGAECPQQRLSEAILATGQTEIYP